MPLRNNIVTGNPYRIPFRYQLRGIGTERDIYYSIPTHKLQRAFIPHAFRQINRNRRMEIDRRYFVLCPRKNSDSRFSIFTGLAYFWGSSIDSNIENKSLPKLFLENVRSGRIYHSVQKRNNPKSPKSRKWLKKKMHLKLSLNFSL